VRFINDVASTGAAGTGPAATGGKPFFAVIAPPAPHSPFTSAPQFDGAFSRRRAPRTPSFNVQAARDKHWLMRQGAPLSAETIERVDDVLRRRWRTLLSVDRMVIISGGGGGRYR